MQIQSFINQYVCYVKDYLAAAIEWKIFKRNNPAIALDVLNTKTNRKGIKKCKNKMIKMVLSCSKMSI